MASVRCRSLIALLSCVSFAALAQPLPYVAERHNAAARPPAVSGESSPRLTIAELVSRIIEAQPDLLAAAQAVESAEAAVLSSRALPNPRFEWQTGPSRQLASGYSGAAQSLIIAQPIENPTLRESRRQVAESGVEVARQTRQVVRNDIAARIKTLASEIEYRQQEALHFAESLALLEQIRERVRRRVEIGEAARYELIKADAEIVTARQRARQATLMIDRVRLAIERLAAGRLPAGWSLQPTWSEALSQLELPAAAELRPDRNPELKLLQQRADQAQRSVALARASVVPAVDLIVSRNREPDLSKNTVGLAVTVPVLDQRQGPIAQARAEAARARTLLDGRRIELTQELLMARKTLEMALSRVRGLSQGALREAESAARVAEAAWQFGERGILDVLDAQRVLRGLRADLIQAQFESHAALIEIERLEGRYADDS